MKKATLWLFISFAFYQQVASQASWEAKYMRAFIVPHNEEMTEMMSHVNMYEFGRQWRIDSGSRVDRMQDHPVSGVALHFYQLGRDLNGVAGGIHGFYEAGRPLSAKLSFRFRLSVGAGYLTEQFHIFSNPKNRAIGSHVNGFMQALGYVDYRGWKYWNAQIGLGMSHYSNGNWSMPNLGINMPGLVAGFSRKDHNSRYVHMKNPRGSMIIWEAGLRAGKRQMSIDDPRNIAMGILEVSFNYPHNDIRGWRGGINVFYDRSYQFTKFQPLPPARLSRVTEIAITGGHEYRFNKVGFVADLGVYLYRPDHSKRMYYEAVGVKYYITDHIVIMNRLKAHLTSADYFEWGINYVLGGRQFSKPGLGNCFRWFFSGMRPVRPGCLNF